MAIFDAIFEFSDAQDISQAVGSVASTNVLNWGDADIEMGAGTPIWLNVQIEEAFAEVEGATNGSSTLTVALVHELDGTIDGSSVVIYQTAALAETALTAGAWVIRMPLPYNVDEQQYLGLYYTIGGATSAVGTVNAWLDHGPQSSFNTQVATSNI